MRVLKWYPFEGDNEKKGKKALKGYQYKGGVGNEWYAIDFQKMVAELEKVGFVGYPWMDMPKKWYKQVGNLIHMGGSGGNVGPMLGNGICICLGGLTHPLPIWLNFAAF